MALSAEDILRLPFQRIKQFVELTRKQVGMLDRMFDGMSDGMFDGMFDGVPADQAVRRAHACAGPALSSVGPQ